MIFKFIYFFFILSISDQLILSPSDDLDFHIRNKTDTKFKLNSGKYYLRSEFELKTNLTLENFNDAIVEIFTYDNNYITRKLINFTGLIINFIVKTNGDGIFWLDENGIFYLKVFNI